MFEVYGSELLGSSKLPPNVGVNIRSGVAVDKVGTGTDGFAVKITGMPDFQRKRKSVCSVVPCRNRQAISVAVKRGHIKCIQQITFVRIQSDVVRIGIEIRDKRIAGETAASSVTDVL